MLFDVTGAAKWCAPCSMSAATGLPTDTWDDKPWDIHGDDPMLMISRALEHVWFQFTHRWIEELPGDSPVIGQSLFSFSLPGRWVIHVDVDGRTDLGADTHVVAVGVELSQNGRWRRLLADNTIRRPRPLARVARYSAYRDAVVLGAVRLREVGDGPDRHRMIDLRPFQRRFIRAATAPGIDTTALSLPRGNGKSALPGPSAGSTLTERHAKLGLGGMIDHPEYTLFSPPTCPTKWDHLKQDPGGMIDHPEYTLSLPPTVQETRTTSQSGTTSVLPH